MSAKYTLGPWRIIKQTPFNQPPVFRIFGKTEHGHDRYITEISLISTDLEEEELSNATLITAAPELLSESEKNLAILIELRDKHLSGCAAVVRALVQKRIEATETAIAKAKGETA